MELITFLQKPNFFNKEFCEKTLLCEMFVEEAEIQRQQETILENKLLSTKLELIFIGASKIFTKQVNYRGLERIDQIERLNKSLKKYSANALKLLERKKDE